VREVRCLNFPALCACYDKKNCWFISPHLFCFSNEKSVSFFILRMTAISLKAQSSLTFLSSRTNSMSITLRRWWQCFKNSKWNTLRSRSQVLWSSWTTTWPSAQQSSKQLKMLNSTMLCWTISHTIKSKSPNVSRRHKQQQVLNEMTQIS